MLTLQSNRPQNPFMVKKKINLLKIQCLLCFGCPFCLRLKSMSTGDINNNQKEKQSSKQPNKKPQALFSFFERKGSKRNRDEGVGEEGWTGTFYSELKEISSRSQLHRVHEPQTKKTWKSVTCFIWYCQNVCACLWKPRGLFLFSLKMWEFIYNRNYLISRLRKTIQWMDTNQRQHGSDKSRPSFSFRQQDVTLGDFSISQNTPTWICVDVTFN